MANLPAGRQDWQKHYFEMAMTGRMIYVYAIKSEERNYIYVGMTNNIQRRLAEHNNGENKSTKAYKPFTLIYSETYASRKEARIREKYLKSGVGKQFLKGLK